MNFSTKNSCGYLKEPSLIGPNKKISVFPVTGLKILGKVGTDFFLS